MTTNAEWHSDWRIIQFILLCSMESKEDLMPAAAVPTAEMLGKSSHTTISGSKLVNAAGNATQSIVVNIHTSEKPRRSQVVIDSERICDGIYEQGSSTRPRDDGKVTGGSSTSSIEKVCVYTLPIQTTKTHQGLRGDQEAMYLLLKGSHINEGIEMEENENTSSKNKGKGRERNPSSSGAISTKATVSQAQSNRDFGNTEDLSSGGGIASFGIPGQVWVFCTSIGNGKTFTLLLIGKYLKLV